MREDVLQHVRSKRTQAKPDVRPQLSHGAKGNTKARPSRKKARRADKNTGAPSGEGSARSQEPEVDSGATTLITIQRESDGRWKWDCYDRFGLKTGTQDKCEDALTAIEGIIGWLNAELVQGDSPGGQARPERTSSAKPGGKTTTSTP